MALPDGHLKPLLPCLAFSQGHYSHVLIVVTENYGLDLGSLRFPSDSSECGTVTSLCAEQGWDISQLVVLG